MWEGITKQFELTPIAVSLLLGYTIATLDYFAGKMNPNKLIADLEKDLSKFIKNNHNKAEEYIERILDKLRNDKSPTLRSLYNELKTLYDKHK